MRRRPKITLRVTPAVVLPAARLRAEVVLTSKADTPCDGITLTLSGHQRRYEREGSESGAAHRVYHRAEICCLTASFPPVLLTAGEHTRSAFFDLPANAPPTFESEWSEIAYRLAVKVDIPWWPDSTADYVVEVAVPPNARRKRDAAVKRYASHAEPNGKELYVEASLDAHDLTVGERIEGAISLANVEHHRIKGVDLALVTIESARVKSSAAPGEIARTTWTIHEGKPAEGAPLRFTIEIPKATVPDFATPFIAVTHAIEVNARVSLGQDRQIILPARIVPPGTRGLRKSRPATIGADKRAENWQRAIEALGRPEIGVVSIDPDTDEVILSSPAGTLRVSAERRGSDGSFLVACATWPSLGMGLVIRDRRWKDLGGIHVGGDWDDARYVVRGREATQVTSFLDARTRAHLAGFADIVIEDRSGRVAFKGSAHNAERLAAFIGAAIDFSDWMSTAYARVAPPVALAHASSAWSNFAARWCATFHPGDFSIDGFSVAGFPMIVRHRWEESTPRDTVIEVPPVQGLVLPDDFVDSTSREMGKRVLVSEQGFVQVWSPLVTDPAALDALLDGLGARLAKLVKGDTSPASPHLVPEPPAGASVDLLLRERAASSSLPGKRSPSGDAMSCSLKTSLLRIPRLHATAHAHRLADARHQLPPRVIRRLRIQVAPHDRLREQGPERLPTQRVTRQDFPILRLHVRHDDPQRVLHPSPGLGGRVVGLGRVGGGDADEHRAGGAEADVVDAVAELGVGIVEARRFRRHRGGEVAGSTRELVSDPALAEHVDQKSNGRGLQQLLDELGA